MAMGRAFLYLLELELNAFEAHSCHIAMRPWLIIKIPISKWNFCFKLNTETHCETLLVVLSSNRPQRVYSLNPSGFWPYKKFFRPPSEKHRDTPRQKNRGGGRGAKTSAHPPAKKRDPSPPMAKKNGAGESARPRAKEKTGKGAKKVYSTPLLLTLRNSLSDKV